MTPENDVQLLDHEWLRVAEGRCEAATARRVRAEAEFEEARQAHKAAQALSDRAVQGQGDVSALEAEHALVASVTALSAATKVRDAAAAAERKANEEKPIARALAHVPVYLEGVRQRIAAAQRADQARAVLAQADRAHEAGSALMRQAGAQGVPHIHGMTGQPRLLGTEAEERALWASVGIDAERGVHPWDPGLKGS